MTLVSWNVRHVAALEYGAAFVTGSTISLLWWLNAGLASEARQRPWSAAYYSLGAGLGTLTGMWLGR